MSTPICLQCGSDQLYEEHHPRTDKMLVLKCVDCGEINTVETDEADDE